MTRFRSLIAATVAVVVAAGLLSSCSSTDAAAVTVNGATYSRSDLTDELDVLVDHPEFAMGMFRVEPGADTVSAVDSAFVAEVLTLRVLIMLIDAEFAERGLSLEDADFEAAEAGFSAELNATLAELPDSYRDDFREWNAKLIALRDAFGAEAGERGDDVTDDAVRTFFEDFPALFGADEVCARHILVTSEDEANEVIAELDGGADFAELAAEHTTDPSGTETGGDLGCTGPGRYVPEFETAVWEGPVGEVQGPIQTDFGYHVILVESRGAPSFESMEADIRAFLESPASRDGQQLLGFWVQQALADADISVDARYGEWDSELGTVQASGTSPTLAG